MMAAVLPIVAVVVAFVLGLLVMGANIRRAERAERRARMAYNAARLCRIEKTKRPSGLDFAVWAEELKEGHKCGPLS